MDTIDISDQTGASDREILFSEIVTRLRSRWLFIVAFTIVATLVTGIYAFIATQWYVAEIKFLPAAARPISAGLNQLSSIASLAGISLPSTGADQNALAVLRSHELLRDFIAAESLGDVLFPGNWMPEGEAGKPSDARFKDMRDAEEKLSEDVVSIAEDKKTGVLTLSVRWKDSRVAASWANSLVQRANAKLRERAIEEAQRNIQYLQEQIEKTTVVPMQQSLGRVLESEMQRYMLANASDEFAFRIVDPAVAPKYRAGPKRLELIFLAFFGGAILSSILVLLTSRWPVQGPGRSLSPSGEG